MASPQKELGHVAIANEVIEAIYRMEIPGRQLRVLLVIIRKTWGWNKKSDLIPLSQFTDETGIARSHVCGVLNWLKAANMVERDKTGRTSIVKDYERWVVPPEGPPSPARGTSRRREFASPAEGNLLVPPAGHSKDILSKDILSKDSIGEIVPSAPSPKEEAQAFFDGDKSETIAYLVAKGIPEPVARREVAKFVSYWTEPNASGKRQRWQMEKTFEYKRRFVTWMQRVAHDRRGSNLTQEPKGIEL